MWHMMDTPEDRERVTNLLVSCSWSSIWWSRSWIWHIHTIQYSGALVVLWIAKSTTTLLLHALHSRRAACVVRYLDPVYLFEEIDMDIHS